MKINKLDKKIHELNVTIEFIELNILDKVLQKRYIKFHKMEIGEKNSMTFVKNLSGKTDKDLDFVKDV